MSACRRRTLDGLLILAIFAAGLTLYMLTLAPTVATVFDDSPEFQLVCYRLGVAHPTGYPLYTLLGKMFTFLPLGDVAYRVNLMSAVFAAATVTLLALLVRELTGRTLVGILAAFALAVSPVFWSQATIAEVYSLHAAFVVACLYLLARWERGGARDPGGLVAVAATFGLGLTHHRTTMLLAPGIVLGVLLARRTRGTGQEDFGSLSGVPKAKKAAKAWMMVLAALAVPTLLYLYIPLVGAHVGSLDGSYRNTVGGFFEHVLALQYGAFLSGNPMDQSRDLAFYVRLLVDQFGLVGSLLGLAGLVIPWRRRRMWLVAWAWLIVSLLFAVVYRVADVEVFLIPVFLLWALGIGMALARLVDGLSSLSLSGLWRPLPGALSVALLLAFVAQPAAVTWSTWDGADRSHDWEVHDVAIDVLGQPLPGGAVIVGILGEATVLHYFQHTRGLRPDLDIIGENREEDRLRALEAAVAGQGEAYLTRSLPGIEARYHLDAVGPLIRVRPKAATSPDTVCPVDVVLPGLCLESSAFEPIQSHHRAGARLTVTWSTVGTIGRDVRISARLLAPEGWLVAQHDSRPVHETYPTTAWTAGETVVDVHDLWLAPGTPAGEYTALLVLYDPSSGQELARRELGRWSHPGSPALPPPGERLVGTPTDVAWGRELALLGYRLHGREVSPGDMVTVEALWRLREPISDEWVAKLSLLRDGEGYGVREYGPAASSQDGAAGVQAVRQWISYPIPASLADGEYTLRMEMWRSGKARRHGPVGLPWPRTGKGIDLGSVIVEGRPRSSAVPDVAHPVDARFGPDDGPIALLGWEGTPEDVRPGETLDVRLIWRAEGEIGRAYSVFVHLLDRSGAIACQQDSGPGLGTLPTSGWAIGEVIDDHHPLDLPADLAPGEYLLQIGLYDPASWERLPVQGSGPGIRADRVILGEIVVR